MFILIGVLVAALYDDTKSLSERERFWYEVGEAGGGWLIVTVFRALKKLGEADCSLLRMI